MAPLKQMYNQMDKGKITDIQLVENFFDDIDLILKIANQQKYYTVDDYNFESGHSNTWPGMRTMCLDQKPDINNLIKHYAEKRFNLYNSDGAFFFHKKGTKDKHKDWKHKDPVSQSLIDYLSKTNVNSGTVFYNDKNEIITDIGFVQNRAICFNGKIPHQSKLNYGEEDDMRLTLNGFFYD